MYRAISLARLPEDLLSLVPGRECGLSSAGLANCAHIGVSTGPFAAAGGAVFSLSLGASCDRYLLDRLILANIADRLALDFDFLGEEDPSAVLVVICVPIRSVSLPLHVAGEDGGDCTFPCRSPRGCGVCRACGWSGGKKGIEFVRAAAMSCGSGVGCCDFGETSARKMLDFEEAFRL